MRIRYGLVWTMLLLATLTGNAQTVRAPRAQALIDALLKEHPEMQTIGLHVTPPGLPDNLNIACSKPGKVGKKSAELDMGVIASGKPSQRMTEKGAYDIGVPLSDDAGHPLGMIVVVIPAARAKNAADAMRQVVAIRDELQRSIPDAASLFIDAIVVNAPLAMIAQTPLPNMKGGFGHFAFDLEGKRIFVAAPENHSIEVFDLAGEHQGSYTGVKTPQALAYVPGRNQLFVADSGDGTCLVIEGKTVREMHVAARIPLGPSIDAGLYDATTRHFYVAGGGEIHIISVDTWKETGRIRVKAAHVGSMAVDPELKRLYVSLSGEGKVAVVSLLTNAEEALWDVPGLLRDTPMALDPTNHRLFVAGAAPGMLGVVDARTGKVLSVTECVEGAADITYDAPGHRLFVTGAEGLGLLSASDPDHYRMTAKFGTMQGKTSIYLPSLRQLYVIHGWSDEDGAGLQVYDVRP